MDNRANLTQNDKAEINSEADPIYADSIADPLPISCNVNYHPYMLLMLIQDVRSEVKRRW